MDHRTPLKTHTVLAFAGMDCHIEEPIGHGSNAIVYKGWYHDSLNRDLRHHVLVKELFPFDSRQKIRRAEDGTIVVDPEAVELWKTNQQSFEIGNKIHLQLLCDHPDLMAMGANLNSFRCNGTLYSVLGYTGGRSLKADLNRSSISLRRTAQRMIRLLDALEAFHKSGYLHMDISPDNTMLVGQGEQEQLFLIDYNSAFSLESGEIVYFSRQAGYSAPEIINGEPDAIGFPTDLYCVAAIFYRCLMGRCLTTEDTIRPGTPEVQDSPLLKDVPQSVNSMVKRILKKGLHSLSRCRYQSICQMKLAFQELLDRIDCLGVTHWSVWENGKRSVEELIAINPSLRYLKDENKLYPIRLEQEYSMTLETYLDHLLSPEGKSGMILAQGGMGKTTLLLYTAMLRGKHYSPAAPAVFYISLYGRNQADHCYIRSQILMRLRFKREENTFDSAMHALQQLLDRPIRTKQGQCPAVLLLLDGLNEVQGDITPLVQEINTLSKLAGVRILAASRRQIPELDLDPVKLMPLDMEDVEAALGRNGLLIPREQNVTHLLRTPLILSIYIQTSEDGRQLNIRSEEELMKAYMDSLLEKEIQQLPEESPQRWQIDVALNYVLPSIAAEVKKQGSALTERKLLAVVGRCWKTLRSPLMMQAFPQWIGRSKAILANTKTAEQWYGIVIHNILYQHLGILTRDTEKTYRIFHQHVEEYLADSHSDMAKQLRTKQRRITIGVIAAYVLFLLCIAAYAKWDEYTGDLQRDLRYSMGQYRNHHAGVIQPDFERAADAVDAYIQDPNGQNAKKAHTVLQNVASDIYYSLKDPLSGWHFAYTSSERYDPETGRLQYTAIDQQVMENRNTPVENLRYLEKDYLDHTVFQMGSPQGFDDYFDLIFVLDALIAYHENNASALPMVSEYASAMREYVQRRGSMLESLYTAYHFDTTAPDLSRLPAMEADLEKLSDTLAEIFQDLPMHYQQKIDEHCSTYMDSSVWTGYYTETFALPPIPAGWSKPDWMPDDAHTAYLITDADSGTIREVTGETEVVPIAWRAVCSDITKEAVMSYVETTIQYHGQYWYSVGQNNFQAVIQHETVCVTIIWTEEKTELIVTGALY